MSVNYISSFDKISKDFINRGIPIEQVGFYDHPKFLDVERRNPEYLTNYAKFVGEKNYSKDYIDKARNDIPIITKILFEELKKDGRLGACIDMSMVLSRILEKKGYWNYIVKGSLTIQFPSESNITQKFFWPIDNTSAELGHVWVVAPPFKVIDVTVKQQHYKDGEGTYLPDFVLEERILYKEPTLNDIISPEVRMYLQGRGIKEANMIKTVSPNLIDFWKVFKTNSIKYNKTLLKYIPTAISAPDSNLENITSLRLNKKYGIDIYKDKILPLLR